VEDLHVHSQRGKHRIQALRLYVEVTSAAVFSLRGLGQGDLAWIAAQQCYQAAQGLDDPVALGFAQFTRSHASVLETGYASALHIAEQVADDMRPTVTDADPEAARVYGTLLLTAAWGASVAGNKSQVATYVVDEAVDVATRIGDPDSTGDAWQTYVRAAVSSLLGRSYRHTSRQLLSLARYVGAMPSK
jgi:hypothetical protein